MKVKELIEELKKMDPELEVLTDDNEHWWYDTRGVRTLYVKHGREQLEPDENPSEGELVVGIY